MSMQFDPVCVRGMRTGTKVFGLYQLTSQRQPVFERKMGVKFIWGEVPELMEKGPTGAKVEKDLTQSCG